MYKYKRQNNEIVIQVTLRFYLIQIIEVLDFNNNKLTIIFICEESVIFVLKYKKMDIIKTPLKCEVNK